MEDLADEDLADKDLKKVGMGVMESELSLFHD
jgi:hypothetical protein